MTDHKLEYKTELEDQYQIIPEQFWVELKDQILKINIYSAILVNCKGNSECFKEYHLSINGYLL